MKRTNHFPLIMALLGILYLTLLVMVVGNDAGAVTEIGLLK
jgi:hypothetical protein